MNYTGIILFTQGFRRNNGPTFPLVFSFSLLMCTLYLCEIIIAIFCLYCIHIDIGYESIVFSYVVAINLHITHYILLRHL